MLDALVLKHASMNQHFALQEFGVRAANLLVEFVDKCCLNNFWLLRSRSCSNRLTGPAVGSWLMLFILARRRVVGSVAIGTAQCRRPHGAPLALAGIHGIARTRA